MNAVTQPVQAAIYTRLSLAVMGDTTKVDDQARICRKLCDDRGWAVFDVYCDNSKSAWQRNRKRPDWKRMLTDVEAGKIGAIVVYHGDRLVRQPFDLETLLNLADGKGIKLASPTGTRDLANGDDLFILRIEVAAACRESWSTSRRKQNEYARLARQGRTRPGGGGGRCFGFETDGITHRPDEAEALRNAAKAIIGGQSLGSVIRDLDARGFRTTAGNPLRQASFRRTLLTPRMAGLLPPHGEQQAAWEPVIDRGEWETMRIVLDGNQAPAAAGRGALYLLSGIAECGACGHVLYAGHDKASSYRCPKPPGCARIRRSRTLLDAYVTGHVVARLSNPANPAVQVPEVPGLATEFRALTEARAEIETALKDHTRGRVPLLLARLDSVDARMAQLRELAGDDARERLRAAHTGITRAEFEALPLDVRRALVRATVRVIVKPASKRGPGFRTEDVVLAPVPAALP